MSLALLYHKVIQVRFKGLDRVGLECYSPCSASGLTQVHFEWLDRVRYECYSPCSPS